MALGIRAGTLGLGPELSVPMASWCTVRVLGHGGTISITRRIHHIEYGADVQFANIGAMVDLHAPHSYFHGSVGVFYNANEWTGRATPDRPVRIGGIRFQPDEVGRLRADVATPEAGVYTGIGFGNPVAPGVRWCVSLDLGVWWFPEPPVARLSADGTLAGYDLFQAALRQEERDVNDELIHWWPVVSLGISYRF